MKTIIFLDIDGVLNTCSTKDRCNGFIGIEDKKVTLLKELVDTLDAQIVLTSTWREEWGSEMGQYLRDKLDKCGLAISGKTPMLRFDNRAFEVKEWLKNHKVDRMVVLDDEDFGWRRYMYDKYWVKTDPCIDGLTEDIVNDIISNKERFNYV